MNMRTKTEALAQLRKPVDLHKLTRAEARVEIARDVLAALKVKKILVGPYGYFDANIEKAGELRDLLAPENVKCQVCAIGAVFTAAVARVDNYAVSPIHIDVAGVVTLSRLACTGKLEPWFTSEELCNVEEMFENYNEDAPWAQWGSALAPDDRLRVEEVKTIRLTALMKHIIETKGAPLVDPPQART